MRYSHKKQKDRFETGAVYIFFFAIFFLVSWNLPNCPKHQESILGNMVSPEEDLLLAGAFHTILDKIEADIHHISKEWNWIVIHQGYFSRMIPAINPSSTPKYVHHKLQMPTWWRLKQICLNVPQSYQVLSPKVNIRES